jgi:transposase
MGRGCIEQEVLYGNNSFRSARRLALTVLLLRENIEHRTISRIVGVSKRQVYNHRKTYELHGAAAMLTDVRHRPFSELELHKDTIKEDLVAHPAGTAAEASERILSLTGIKRSPSWVRTFMHRLGLRQLKVAQTPSKADPAAQSASVGTEPGPRIQ